MKKAKVSILLGLLLLASCSTTRSLSEDQSRLASNSIQISGDKKLSTNEVAQYIRQEPNRGFLFGSLNADVVSLEEHLGDARVRRVYG